MAGINKVMVLGRLGADPELKTVGQGQTVARLNVATSENWTDKQGQKQERTEWHRIVVWGKQGENCGKYLSKGRQVFVEGRLQTRSWEDQQGQKKYSTEIVADRVQFIGGSADQSQQRPAGASAMNNSNSSDDMGGFQDFGPEPSFDNSDEIPF